MGNNSIVNKNYRLLDTRVEMCLLLDAAALLMAGTFGLALAAGGQGTEQAAAVERVERNGLFGKSIGLSQAAIELQVSFVLLLRVFCVDCTCVGPRIDAINEQCV